MQKKAKEFRKKKSAEKVDASAYMAVSNVPSSAKKKSKRSWRSGIVV